ncbi:PREDICTED: inhibitor of Bruton tyrosine kinase-like isoform X3 [Acropora digitifera]|uniref:inhibitor of Bruton tyrosine kinase-like isoform X3 n=1 Tax=Acropora digitifera TaxID=70779 RepID=UPI00077A0C16|nr:PREDICTED: inhibitor of Bruton tyrosine kinase-like isoform X3 [Acropora digitifera]
MRYGIFVRCKDQSKSRLQVENVTKARLGSVHKPAEPCVRFLVAIYHKSSEGGLNLKQLTFLRKRQKREKLEEREVGGEQDKPIPVAWGGVSKEPSPVKSLRDLMQEEEQRLPENKQESKVLPPASPRAHSSPGKSGCTTNKLNVWQVSPVAGSPPSWSVAFSSIIESQEIENTTLERVSRKPFHLTQLEEKAMEELLQHYGGQDNACEFVTVQRIGSTIAKPVWKKERSLSTNSN